MNAKKTALTAVVLIIVCLLSVAIFASAESTEADAMTAIELDAELAAYKQGETVALSTDGYIGIPVEISVYYDGSSVAKPGYDLDSTPVVLYVVNASIERIGTDSDVDIIKGMISRGYAVAVCDYLNNEKAVSPALDWSAQTLRNKLKSGAYFENVDVLPSGTYYNSFVVPAGYDLSINHVFWEMDKHGTDGTLDKIVEIWNNDFRGVKAETLVKWTDGDGNRKATQNGHDGSEPVWLDANGNADENGEYIKIKHTLATTITDCVKKDGSPIDLSLYMHLIYPTGGVEVPVLTLVGSAEHLADGAATADRPQLVGAVFNGYAGVMYDHGYTPMARNDHYGYFDGNAAAGHITGDNLTYSIQFYNSVEINTAAMRYIRYLSLSDERFSFDLDAIGAYGNSKGGWMQFLGEEDPYSTPNRRMFPGHHGETRYENGDTLTVGIIDGGEEQPWLTYEGEEIDGGADLIYCSCGGTVDSITSTHAPTFITCNLSDGSYYWTSNDFVNICRRVDARAMWFEVPLGHTLGYGKDMNYGVDVYEAFFNFAGYWLKNDPVKVSYITSDMSYGGMPTYAPISVKFTGTVAEDELARITLAASDGVAVDGYWTSAFGGTEWTFHPAALLSNTKYTLTVPVGIVGSNGLPSTEAQSYTFTTGYESAMDGEGVTRVTGNNGTYLHFSMPDASGVTEFGVNKYLLRVNVTNDAVNKLGVYSVTGFDPSAPDASTVGACLGTIAVNGRGYYELDLTDYLDGVTATESCTLLVKQEKTAASTTVYTATFNGVKDSGISVSSSVDYEISEVNGNGALQLGLQALDSRYVNDTFYGGHSLSTSLACFGTVGGKNLTYDDVGRRFVLSFRVYDTVERYVGVAINNCTSSSAGTVDYNAYKYNLKTKANEWVTFSFAYDVYEPAMFGDSALVAKTLSLTVPGYGNLDNPIYFDDFSSTEITTDVTFAEDDGVALVLSTTKQRTDPLETPYGTIPSLYEDDELYPFALFKKTASGYEFITALADAFADSTVTNYWALDTDIVIYLRRDYTAVSRFTNLRQCMVGVTLDLGGNTLTANAASQTVYVVGNAPKYSTVTNLYYNFKNGTIITGSKAFLLVGSTAAGGDGVRYSVTFDNITFERPDNVTNAHPIVEFTNSTSTFTTDITYNDCTFDMTGAEAILRVFTAGNSADTARANVVVNGGELILSTTSKVALTYAPGASSSVSFGSGSDGYIKILLPVGSTAPAFAVSDKTGNSLSFVKQGTEGTKDVYTLISLKTPYGDIPSKYASVADYPFALFKKTASGYEFITALADAFADSTVTNYWALDTDIVIYLRRDYTAVSRFTNLRQCMVGVTLDLGGNTLTANAASQTVYVVGNAPKYSTVTNLYYNFKNGTIITGSKAFLLVGSNAAGGDGVRYSVTFDNITFERPDTVTNAHPIVEFTNSTSTFTTDITYNDCTFDMTGAEAILRVFTAGNAADTARANVVVNGGELILSTSNKVLLTYALGSSSSVRFGKGENGYLKVKLPAGATALGPEVTSVSGLTCILTKAETVDSLDCYVLTPKVISGFTVKGNITLYTDFEYNVYIPAISAVKSVTLGDTTYTELSDMRIENVDGVDYYVITVRISLTSAADVLPLTVTLAEEGGATVTGSWSVSVVNYLERLITTEQSDTAKTLAKDILSYIRAAYAYASLDETVITRIDGIIGSDYDLSSVPDTDVTALQSVEGLTSASLLLGDAPAFRFGIDSGYDPSLFVFAINGVTLRTETHTDSNGKTYVTAYAYAYMMTEAVTYTVTGTDIRGEFNLKAYYDYALKNESDELISLVERLWKYSESAAAYKAEISA